MEGFLMMLEYWRGWFWVVLQHYIEVDAFMLYARAEMVLYTQSPVFFPSFHVSQFDHSASAANVRFLQ
jgi:hypothetical protein